MASVYTDHSGSVYYNHGDRTEDRALRSAYGKQGHICCFCCCDMRRAAIMANIFNIFVSAVSIGGVYAVATDLLEVDSWFEQAYEFVDGVDDDELQKDFHTLVDNFAWVIYTFYGLGCFFSILGIFGAKTYRPKLVFTCAIWYVIGGLASLFFLGWGGIGILYTGLLAYPNVMLYQEMIERIMTKASYSDVEAYSFCCLGNGRRKLTMREAIEHRLGVFS